jgi:hypothetical protein
MKKEVSKYHTDSTSVPGVRKNKGGRYIATYVKFIGTFDTIAEAKAAKEAWVKKAAALDGPKPKKEKKAKSEKKPKAEKKAKASNGGGVKHETAIQSTAVS